MSHSASRSSFSHEEELRLPRPPGIIRRFWARHPFAADVVIAVLCLLLAVAPATIFNSDSPPRGGADVNTTPTALVASITITILVVITCVLLLRRRQWPVTVFIASYAVAVAYLFMLEPAGGALLLVTSYTLAVYRSTLAAWTGLGIGIGTLALVSLILERTGTITVQIALNGVFGQLTLALIGTLIGINVGGRKRYLDAVIERSRQLLVERDQHGQIAAAAERARIAREMHDIVSHSLTVIVALSEGAAATDDRQRAREAADAAAETARGALAEMRSMLGVLRDGGGELPLAPSEPVSPRSTVAAAQRAGYPVTLTVSGDTVVSAATSYAVGRIVQEGVTNAMRHAPEAQAIAVDIKYLPESVVVRIQNDGVSGSVGTSGFGLRGLSERAAHVNGEVSSTAIGDGRWLLHAQLPADPTRERDA